MNTKWDNRFLDIARSVSYWSKDPSTKCGAVIVDAHAHILSVGYNGFPAGMPDLDASYLARDEKYSRIIHCEMNALLHVGTVTSGATLYTYPFLSCDRCTVHMLQAGIMRFVAPVNTDDRWAASIAKTKRYIEECGGTYREV